MDTINIYKKHAFKLLGLCAFVGSVNVFSNTTGLEPPPHAATVDDAGVNLLSGMAVIGLEDLKIGNGDNALNHKISTYGNVMYGFLDNFSIKKQREHNQAINNGWRVIVGESSTLFSESNLGTFTNLSKDGATLELLRANRYLLTRRDGSTVEFTSGVRNRDIQIFTQPNGFEIRKHLYQAESPSGIYRQRVQSIVTNTGLQFKFKYTKNRIDGNDRQDLDDFSMPTSIVAINNAVEHCPPGVNSCNLSGEWAEVKYIWPTYSQTKNRTFSSTVKSPFGTTKYNHTLQPLPCSRDQSPKVARITSIKDSTSASTTTKQYEYGHEVVVTTQDCIVLMSNVVKKVRSDSNVWDYDYNVVAEHNYHGTASSTSQYSSHRVTIRNLFTKINQPSRFHFNLSDTRGSVSYSENIPNRPTSVNLHGEGTNQYTYNGFGAITKIHKPGGSNLSDQTSTAGFANCNSLNKKWCKEYPVWTQDANGNRTDYTYHNESGLIKTKTLPAPVSGSARPQTRYFYKQQYAWYKAANNNIVRASSPIWLLDSKSECTDGSPSGYGCADSNKEVITRYEYGNGSYTSANNLWLKGVSVNAYNPNLGAKETLRTCYSYDQYGNRVSETSPNANLASCQ